MTTTYTPQEIMDKAENATTVEELIEAIVLLKAGIVAWGEQDLDTVPTVG